MRDRDSASRAGLQRGPALLSSLLPAWRGKQERPADFPLQRLHRLIDAAPAEQQPLLPKGTLALAKPTQEAHGRR